MKILAYNILYGKKINDTKRKNNSYLKVTKKDDILDMMMSTCIISNYLLT